MVSNFDLIITKNIFFLCKFIGNTFENVLGLGIDLSANEWTGDDVTINDSGDVDSGTNSFQNYPDIENVKYIGNGNYILSGVVDGVDAESPFVIEICESNNHVSGHGSCKDSLSFTTTVELEGEHRWEVMVNVPGSTGDDNRVFTALTTNVYDSTSEFSPQFFANLENTKYTKVYYDLSLLAPTPLANTNDQTPLFDWSSTFEGESIVAYPKYLSEVTTGANYSYDFKKDGDYLYIAHYGLVSIIDISDPTNLKVVSAYTGAAGTGANSRVLDIQDGKIFTVAGSWGGITTIGDISDPLNPTHIKTLGGIGGGSPLGIKAHGDYLYVKTSVGLAVLDIADIFNPVLLTVVPTSAATSFSNSIRIYEDYLYLSTNTNLEVFSISNPENPVNVLTILIGTSSSIELDGSRLYVSLVIDSRVIVFDLSSPANPDLILDYKYSDINNTGLTHLAISGDYVFIGKVGVGIVMVDIGDLNSPVVLKTMQDGLNIFSSGVILDGNVLYTDNYDINSGGTATIRAIDIGENFPESILEVADSNLSGYKIFLNNQQFQMVSNSITEFQTLSPLDIGSYNWRVEALWEDGSVAGISNTSIHCDFFKSSATRCYWCYRRNHKCYTCKLFNRN